MLSHRAHAVTTLPSPKLRVHRSGPESWFRYYAGYNCDFVRATLQAVGTTRDSVVLDPWNGAGTTTQVAHELGLRSIGLDINPAVMYVAAARVCDEEGGKLALSEARSWAERALLRPPTDADPLIAWIGEEGAQAVRAIQSRLTEVGKQPFVLRSNSTLLPRHALHFVALFRALGELTSSNRASNPTWLKKPQQPTMQRLGAPDVLNAYLSAMTRFVQAGFTASSSFPMPEFRLGSATRINLPSRSVDCVVASPPYCTRIDYVVSTRLELAILGIGEDETLRALRDSTTGTTTIRGAMSPSSASWGTTALRLLDRISTHPSKAAVSYYAKFYSQYFHDMAASIQELARCLRRNARCILVVQDSYFKDVHIPLATVLTEMAQIAGWRARSQLDFPVARSISNVNSRSRVYVERHKAIESVVDFEVIED